MKHEFLEPSNVYRPADRLYSIDPANFQPKRGILTRYGKRTWHGWEEKEKAEAMIRVRPKKYRSIDDPAEVSDDLSCNSHK